MTSFPLKKKPSQVAQADTPRFMYSVSPLVLSHLAEAPVARMIDWASTSWLSPLTRKGRWLKSISTTFSMCTVDWNRSACFWNFSIRSGPVTPSGKPG